MSLFFSYFKIKTIEIECLKIVENIMQASPKYHVCQQVLKNLVYNKIMSFPDEEYVSMLTIVENKFLVNLFYVNMENREFALYHSNFFTNLESYNKNEEIISIYLRLFRQIKFITFNCN